MIFLNRVGRSALENNKKKTGVVVSIPDKLDLNAKSTFRIKVEYFITVSH